jgi:hypothetical protein
VSTATSTLLLTNVRAALATALAPVEDDDPNVLADLVDAIDPPVLMLEWSDPWLTPRTVGQGWWDAHLNVLAIAGRLEPGPGVERLEQLAQFVIARLSADSYSWPVESMTAPRRFDIAGLTYLGARVSLRVPVTVEEE